MKGWGTWWDSGVLFIYTITERFFCRGVRGVKRYWVVLKKGSLLRPLCDAPVLTPRRKGVRVLWKINKWKVFKEYANWNFYRRRSARWIFFFGNLLKLINKPGRTLIIDWVYWFRGKIFHENWMFEWHTKFFRTVWNIYVVLRQVLQFARSMSPALIIFLYTAN